MKLVINKGVRQTMQELEALFEKYDELQQIALSPASAHTNRPDAEVHAMRQNIVGAAARMISHATRGKRYPFMTEGKY